MTTPSQKPPQEGDYKKFEEARWSIKNQKLVFRHTAAYELLMKCGATSFLDVGCGDGIFEGYVAEHHPEIVATGVDLSDVAIEKARTQFPSATFVLGDATTGGLSFEDASFDVVIALDVLEHLFVPQDLLREMKRVSKKHIIVGVPNFSSFPARLQMLFGRTPENNRPKKGHAYWFNYVILTKLLTENGFLVEEIKINYQLMRYPLVGTLIGRLAHLFPNLLALSFVVRARKNS